MPKTTHLLFLLFSVILFMPALLYSQGVTIKGIVKNSITNEPLPSVTIMSKGMSSATKTDSNGIFKLNVTALPIKLSITHVGFQNQDVDVNSNKENISVALKPLAFEVLNEVVVLPTGMPERLINSPVSVEQLSSTAIRHAAAPNFYESIVNLKGVDVTTSSLTFRTVSTRGFNGSGNYRMNQFMDGMNNQAPGLNFSLWKFSWNVRARRKEC